MIAHFAAWCVFNEIHRVMHHEKEYIEIAELIHARHAGTATPQQEQRLEEWIRHNGGLYDRIVGSADIARDVHRLAGFDPRQDISLVRRKIAAREGRRRRRVWMGRAAAVVVPALLCAYLIVRLGAGGTPAQDSAIAERSPKALLILDSGERIELDEQSAGKLVGGAIAAVEPTGISYTRDEGVAGLNTVIVPRGGSYTVNLADGTTVNLNSDSRITYPANFSGDLRQVRLEGEAYFTVARSEVPFVVVTRLGEVKVYGTQFNVRQYADEAVIKTTLVEGSVSYRNDLIPETKLTPNQQLTYVEGDPAFTVEQVNTESCTAWRNDILCFEDETLYDIMRTLARWYDIEFTFADPELSAKRLSGRLGRYAGFESFVKIFSGYGDLEFSVEGRHVTVSGK